MFGVILAAMMLPNPGLIEGEWSCIAHSPNGDMRAVADFGTGGDAMLTVSMDMSSDGTDGSMRARIGTTYSISGDTLVMETKSARILDMRIDGKTLAEMLGSEADADAMTAMLEDELMTEMGGESNDRILLLDEANLVFHDPEGDLVTSCFRK